MIKITFPDGNVREFSAGITPFQVAESISPRLAADIVAATVDGNQWDISRPISSNASIKLHKFDEKEGKHAFWHSSAHLMAEALQNLYPGVKFGIGPAIENGFYYDIDLGDKTINDKDLPAIEEKMLELARRNTEYCRKEVSKQEALEFFGSKDEKYKVELISELADGTITFYSQGNFTDLCRGPHLPNTSEIKSKTYFCCRCLLERRRETQTTHPHLRNHLPEKENARRIPRYAGES